MRGNKTSLTTAVVLAALGLCGCNKGFQGQPGVYEILNTDLPRPLRPDGQLGEPITGPAQITIGTANGNDVPLTLELERLRCTGTARWDGNEAWTLTLPEAQCVEVQYSAGCPLTAGPIVLSLAGNASPRLSAVNVRSPADPRCAGWASSNTPVTYRSRAGRNGEFMVNRSTH